MKDVFYRTIAALIVVLAYSWSVWIWDTYTREPDVINNLVPVPEPYEVIQEKVITHTEHVPVPVSNCFLTTDGFIICKLGDNS